MANTSNAVYSVGASGQSAGPAFTGQIMVQNLGDPEARYFKGTSTVTGDGATATWTINWIDGVQTLPYVPSGVLVTRTAGVAGISATTIPLAVSNITNTSFTVTFGANLAASSVTIAFMAWK